MTGLLECIDRLVESEKKAETSSDEERALCATAARNLAAHILSGGKEARKVANSPRAGFHEALNTLATPSRSNAKRSKGTGLNCPAELGTTTHRVESTPLELGCHHEKQRIPGDGGNPDQKHEESYMARLFSRGVPTRETRRPLLEPVICLFGDRCRFILLSPPRADGPRREQ